MPEGLNVSFPLFYAIGANDDEMRTFREHWVTLRKKDGTLQEYYNQWILGEIASQSPPRWCVIRDALQWVD